MSIHVDDRGVSCAIGEIRESVAWADLRRVTILRTDEGPFSEDVWWLLKGAAGGVAVPGSIPEARSIMAQLERMPGYLSEAVMQAMMCTENVRFIVWEKPK